MLTEDRFSRILAVVDAEGSVTVTDLVRRLETSESTIRRDLTAMHKKGLLTKVYGGAISLKRPELMVRDEKIVNRKAMYAEEKEKIARYAASLIGPEDFFFLDAGTTTEMMIDYITSRQAVFVTHAVNHALRLAALDVRVILLGGEVKSVTETAVGEEALEYLEKFRFTKGFFGTNGISIQEGFTTPDPEEGEIKRTACLHCAETYILADLSKFNVICTYTFAPIDKGFIVTDSSAPKIYRDLHNTILVDLIENPY